MFKNSQNRNMLLEIVLKGFAFQTLHRRFKTYYARVYYLMGVQLGWAANDGGGEDGSCKCNQEDQDHQQWLGKKAVSKVGVEYEQEDGECRGCNRGDHRGDCEAPANVKWFIQNQALPVSRVSPQSSCSQPRDDEHRSSQGNNELLKRSSEGQNSDHQPHHSTC